MARSKREFVRYSSPVDGRPAPPRWKDLRAEFRDLRDRRGGAPSSLRVPRRVEHRPKADPGGARAAARAGGTPNTAPPRTPKRRPRKRSEPGKLVVFVPREALDAVRATRVRGGTPGGSATTSAAPGTRPGRARSSAARGRPRASARPGGRSGSPSSGSRPSTRRAGGRSRRALREAHPYEEPAFDLYPLADAVKARLFTDGGARGNPGPAAYAYVLEAEDGTVLDARARRSAPRRTTSPSTAALVAGLERAAELGVDELEVVSDSELLVKQMRGEYRVKNEALRSSRWRPRGSPGGSARDLHGRAPRAQRARRQPRQRGAGRGGLGRVAPPEGGAATPRPSCFALQEGTGEMFALLRGRWSSPSPYLLGNRLRAQPRAEGSSSPAPCATPGGDSQQVRRRSRRRPQ